MGVGTGDTATGADRDVWCLTPEDEVSLKNQC